MSNYWIDHYNSSVERFPDSPLKQVGKTVNGQEVGIEQVMIWVHSIVSALSIGHEDNVADLCCGNGLITRIIANRCRNMTGVDFSEKLIQYARHVNDGANICYQVGNVAELAEGYFSGISKVYMYEAVQHLSAQDFEKLLSHIHRSSDVNAFFVGGIPDIERFDIFYDTEEKRAFHKEREDAGKPHIGKWWSRDELTQVVERNGLKAAILSQGPELYCSHFRFDCLITRY